MPGNNGLRPLLPGKEFPRANPEIRARLFHSEKAADID
jgi:hypothetical protein